MGMPILDTFGVPEFFVTHVGAIEYAEGGNIRIVRCIKRGNVLMPVFSLVSPVECLITGAQQVRDTAQDLFNLNQHLVSSLSH